MNTRSIHIHETSRRIRGLQVQRTHQETGHLRPRHRPIRTEPQRLSPATGRHPRREQSLDTGRMNTRSIHIHETSRRIRRLGRAGVGGTGPAGAQ